MVKKCMYTENGENCEMGFFNYSKKSVFNVCLVVVVVVVQFRQVHLKNQTRYRVETLHDDWNP